MFAADCGSLLPFKVEATVQTYAPMLQESTLAKRPALNSLNGRAGHAELLS